MAWTNEQLALGMLVAVAVIILWIIFYPSDERTLVPGYYGPYNPTGPPQVNWWQQTTQGGLQNPIVGTDQMGNPLGAYDYLGQNYTGYNALPGDWAEMQATSAKLCGCGCGKPAANVVNSLCTTGSKIPGATGQLPASNSPIVTAGSVANDRKNALATARIAQQLGTPLPNGAIQKIAPPSATPNAPVTRSFFSAFNIHDPSRDCAGGAVRGGRSDCSNGIPSDNAVGIPRGFSGSRRGFATRGFGADPGENLAETVGTVNSSRHLGPRPYDPTNYDRRMAAISAETNMIAAQIPSAASKVSTTMNGAAALAASGSTKDQNPINAFQDSPMNGPRKALPTGTYNYRGNGEVSSFDHRRR